MEHAQQHAHRHGGHHADEGAQLQRDAGDGVQGLGDPGHDDSTQGHLGAHGQVDFARDHDQAHAVGNHALHGRVAQHVEKVAGSQEGRLHNGQGDDDHDEQQLDHVIQQEIVCLLLGEQTHLGQFQGFPAHSMFPPMQ